MSDKTCVLCGGPLDNGAYVHATPGACVAYLKDRSATAEMKLGIMEGFYKLAMDRAEAAEAELARLAWRPPDADTPPGHYQAWSDNGDWMTDVWYDGAEWHPWPDQEPPTLVRVIPDATPGNT